MVYDMNRPDISFVWVEQTGHTDHGIMDIPSGLADERAHWEED
jgi:hypothetical protein